METKFIVKQVPFYQVKEIDDSCPRFTVITSLKKYPKIIQSLINFQRIMKAENIFYKDRFYLKVKKSEKKKPKGWSKFMREKIRDFIDIEFDIDNIRVSGKTGRKYINFKLFSISFSK